MIPTINENFTSNGSTISIQSGSFYASSSKGLSKRISFSLHDMQNPELKALLKLDHLKLCELYIEHKQQALKQAKLDF
jgi:hypothetical protein